MKKKLQISMLLLLIIVCLVSACGSDAGSKNVDNDIESLGQDIADHVGSIIQSQEEHVLMVKNGSPVSYPDCPYGEVFDEFFASPTWTYFQADTGEDVVEFTGRCTYMDTEVEARLQFILDTENGTFEAGALSFNDVPQANLITIALIQKAFEEYANAHGIALADGDFEWDFDEGGSSYEMESYGNVKTDESASNMEMNSQEKALGSAKADSYYDIQESEYILPESDSRYLTEADLAGLDTDMLRLARNEIYARHGRLFQTEDLNAYFNSKSWYHGYLLQ